MKKSNSYSPLTKRLLTQMGENIKMARLRRDLSLKGVAERAGLALNTVVAIEKGASGSSMGAIASVLQSLNLTEDISFIAKDDLLGRKLQDLKITPKKRASKKGSSHE
jgi:transcriptional regulator with XRE-family HTH domain